MILSRFRKSADQSNLYATYATIVAQSRQQFFYADWGVPDTVTGRFDMICVHMSLLFRRLKTGDAKNRDFSQKLFDLFFKDMDRSLREMGAGDMAVPKRIQKMGELFYGMLAGLTDALEKPSDAELAEVLKKNVYGDEESVHLPALCTYVRAYAGALNEVSDETILNGELKPGLAVDPE